MGGWQVGVASFGVPLARMGEGATAGAAAEATAAAMAAAAALGEAAAGEAAAAAVGNAAGCAAAAAAACYAFRVERGVDVLVLMCAFDDPAVNGAFRRQLALTAAPGSAAAALMPGLVEALGPGLGGLNPVHVEGLGPMAFDQGDAKGSRKKVQPIMLEHLSKQGVAQLN